MFTLQRWESAWPYCRFRWRPPPDR